MPLPDLDVQGCQFCQLARLVIAGVAVLFLLSRR